MSRVMAGAVLALLLALPVQAQTNVYKCIDGPHAVYQQTPCQGQAEWKWHVPAETSLARPARPAAPTAARPHKRRSGAAQAVHIPLERDPVGCSRARQRQADAVQADYLQQRRLQDAVRAACR